MTSGVGSDRRAGTTVGGGVARRAADCKALQTTVAVYLGLAVGRGFHPTRFPPAPEGTASPQRSVKTAEWDLIFVKEARPRSS